MKPLALGAAGLSLFSLIFVFLSLGLNSWWKFSGVQEQEGLKLADIEIDAGLWEPCVSYKYPSQITHNVVICHSWDDFMDKVDSYIPGEVKAARAFVLLEIIAACVCVGLGLFIGLDTWHRARLLYVEIFYTGFAIFQGWCACMAMCAGPTLSTEPFKEITMLHNPLNADGVMDGAVSLSSGFWISVVTCILAFPGLLVMVVLWREDNRKWKPPARPTGRRAMPGRTNPARDRRPTEVLNPAMGLA
jgi:hypothetical protein